MTQVANYVLEISTSTGTGNLTLETGENLYPNFTAIYAAGFSATFGTGSTNKFYYGINHTTEHEREWGIGYMSDATTLVRETVLGSSNSGAAVDFSAGTKIVTNDVPAERQITRGQAYALQGGVT